MVIIRLCFILDEYDHLDYTRPVTALKPNYQRMASPFGSRDLKDEKPEGDGGGNFLK